MTETDVLEVVQALANPAEVGPYKIVVADPPTAEAKLDDLRSWRSRLGDTARIGLFGPWLRVAGTTGAEEALVSVPPCGHVCGAFAAAEREGGIHRSGANRPLRFVEGLTLDIDDAEQGVLNPAGINAIRAFPGRGIRANGSRTLSSEPEWRFLTTRRIVDAIEKTLESSLAWVAFEPNNLLTRHTVTVAVATFLNRTLARRRSRGRQARSRLHRQVRHRQQQRGRSGRRAAHRRCRRRADGALRVRPVPPRPRPGRAEGDGVARCSDRSPPSISTSR